MYTCNNLRKVTLILKLRNPTDTDEETALCNDDNTDSEPRFQLDDPDVVTKLYSKGFNYNCSFWWLLTLTVTSVFINI